MYNQAKIRELAKKLNPIDDIFFKKMAEYRPFCQEILQVILGDKNLIVTENTPQYTGTNLQGRSVILDVKCILGTGEQVNIEVQKADNDDHQRRVRYNGSILTTNITDPGSRFADVPDVILIYISKFDIFNKAKTIYHVERIIQETGDIVDNGFKEIYVNASIDDGSDIAQLMKVFTDSNTYNAKFPETSKRKRLFKGHEDGESIMNEELERLFAECQAEYRAEGLAAGRAEGLAAGRAEGLATGRAEGLATGRAEGKTEGMIATLSALVKDGILTVTAAAKRAGMTEDAFRKIGML